MSASICPKCDEQQFWDNFHQCDACGYRDNVTEVDDEDLDELRGLAEWALEARQALELVASPKRSDGTYNRCREACEVLANEVLSKFPGNKDE